MDPLSEIRKSIRSMSSGDGSASIFTAKVLSTDGDTCCVDVEGLVVSDVRLRAVVNGEESGILVTPKTDSYVTVADLSGGRLTRCVLIGYSEAEKIEVNADDKIIFNGGENHGLVKVEEMVNWMRKVYNDLQTLTTLLSGSAVVGNGEPLGITFTPTTPSPDIDNFQNKDITH